jgi:hypothetical protein
MYLFLISQPDLSRAGVITIALHRWASCVNGYDNQRVLQVLGELASHRFVVVDMGCEELLVRSFIRWDEGWKSPNIMISIKQSAVQVMSETLRAVIRDEVAKIDTSHLPTKLNSKTNRSTKDFIELVVSQLVDALSDCKKDSAVLDWNPSVKGSSNPSVKGSSNEEIEPLPEGLTEGSLTTTATATVTATATATATRKNAVFTQSEEYSQEFEQFWEVYPRKQGKKDAAEAYRIARAKKQQTYLVAKAQRYAQDPNREDRFTRAPATWLSGEHWEDAPEPSRQPRALSRPMLKTDRASAEWDNDRRILAQLEAEEASQRRNEGGNHAIEDRRLEAHDRHQTP